MIKNTLIFVFSFLILACSPKTETKETERKSTIYKQSEMAALMLQMYAVNLENKELILKGEKPKDFPKEFLAIHTANLTDSTDRNATFNAFSDIYLANLKAVFNSSKDSLILQHNTTINSCIACHKTTCIGPIPKIKKLLIPSP
ncbi:hypothetical protein [Polaribacter tangerinus]|uniref:hypothetical protein n=1 Tax=Polaribacter tangerinus TaxID=1920034 RepID=UPI000B4B5F49|nr:hypothetical protein [Polaribacter tangerinus]